MPLPQAVEIRVTGTGTRITVVDRVARALAREGLVWVSADTTADLETMPGITFERLAAPAGGRAQLRRQGVDQVIAISGISALDNSSSLANAGVAYLIWLAVATLRHGAALKLKGAK